MGYSYDKLKMLEKAIKLIDSDDFNESVPLLKAILEKTRDHKNVSHCSLEYAFIEGQMFEQAIKELSRLAIKLMEAERYSEAVPLLKAILEKDPNYGHASCNLGFCYIELKLLDQAIAVLNEYVAKHPQDANAYHNLGCAYSNQKIYELYELAIQNYTKAIELNPRFVQAYGNRGNCYREQKMYDLAIRDHSKIIELYPKNPLAYNNRGNCYCDQKMYDLAIRDYTKAIELDPKYSPTYNNRGSCYRDQKMYDLAIRDHSKAIELDPKYSPAYYNRGNCYFDQKTCDLAIRDYTKAIELDPKNSLAYYNRGNCYFDQKMYDLAIRDCTEAIELDPKKSSAYNNRGICYLRIGRFDAALDDCCQVAKLRYPQYDPKELVHLIQSNEPEKGVAIFEMLKSKCFEPIFIGELKENFIVMPTINDRLILVLENMHISDTYKRILRQKQGRYKLCFDFTDSEYIFKRCLFHHNDPEGWLPMEEVEKKHIYINKYCKNAKAITVALYEDDEIVAGDVGLMLGDEYTSFTGFKDKSNAGKIMLFLIAEHLVALGVKTWDFGGTSTRWDSYKLEMGCKRFTTEEYMSLRSEKLYR